MEQESQSCCAARKCHYLEANWLKGMAASCRCRFSSRMSHSLMTRPLDCSIRMSYKKDKHIQYFSLEQGAEYSTILGTKYAEVCELVWLER